jgi:hypothetical protein
VYIGVDNELGVCCEECADGRLWIVARPPGTVGEHALGHVFDDRIKDATITAGRDERGVRLAFGEDVVDAG